MIPTEEYYKQLYDYMMETPLVLPEDIPDEGMRAPIPDVLVPAISYYAASCPKNQKEIQELAESALEQDEERWRDACRKSRETYEVEGLVRPLSAQGQDAYRNLTAACAMWGQTARKLVLYTIVVNTPML